MSEARRSIGRRGEALAIDALKRSGYRILERNYWCPLGELDVIARQGKTLVFVEVKSDKGPGAGLAKDRVDSRKRRKLVQVAQYYLKEKRLREVSARFDVIQVGFQAEGSHMVEIIPNAFDANGE